MTIARDRYGAPYDPRSVMSSPTPRQAPPEYDVADTGRLTSSQRTELLNDRAADGWELDKVDGVRYIFKRPVSGTELRER